MEFSQPSLKFADAGTVKRRRVQAHSKTSTPKLSEEQLFKDVDLLRAFHVDRPTDVDGDVGEDLIRFASRNITENLLSCKVTESKRRKDWRETISRCLDEELRGPSIKQRRTAKAWPRAQAEGIFTQEDGLRRAKSPAVALDSLSNRIKAFACLSNAPLLSADPPNAQGYYADPPSAPAPVVEPPNGPATSPLESSKGLVQMWCNCSGGPCEFDCLIRINGPDIDGVSNSQVEAWMLRHGLVEVRKCCGKVLSRDARRFDGCGGRCYVCPGAPRRGAYTTVGKLAGGSPYTAQPKQIFRTFWLLAARVQPSAICALTGLSPRAARCIRDVAFSAVYWRERVEYLGDAKTFTSSQTDEVAVASRAPKNYHGRPVRKFTEYATSVVQVGEANGRQSISNFHVIPSADRTGAGIHRVLDHLLADQCAVVTDGASNINAALQKWAEDINRTLHHTSVVHKEGKFVDARGYGTQSVESLHAMLKRSLTRMCYHRKHGKATKTDALSFHCFYFRVTRRGESVVKSLFNAIKYHWA